MIKMNEILLQLSWQTYAFSVSFDANNLVSLAYQLEQYLDNIPLIWKIVLCVHIRFLANFQ